jgi:hypothetical protein
MSTLSVSLYRWVNWGTEEFSDVAMVILPIVGRALQNPEFPLGIVMADYAMHYVQRDSL